ncbi:Nitrite reductase (NADH) small subunit [compost metagenome]|jgi:nitrite reductase (NADH) small subunit|uniref:nitrite reductase small subunit NirD n=1 Tax=Pseudomonas TaxID=286 RepID=UPI000419DC05|nr:MULTISPECIES: nitrite reductase small subunit NirD [Pseudomonas]MCW2270243.1 nitrite reductase (NADH) small subunit [Pseudomonas sp. JUb96]PRA66443.1 nitrite reductase (NAD(P)H) small subunit [Pseudomonas sp. MYb187]
MSVSTVAVNLQARHWQAVCNRDDLVAQSGVVVWFEGRQVALFYLPGQSTPVYAVDNVDPRSGANVIGRGLVGHLNGELVVAAPLYKQHFCLSDGRCLEDAGQALQVWPVRLCGDQVEIGQAP